jgi:NAD(P)-dependent dehydrogenase (short-subunit alcohol dehydrogenase family)
MSRVWRWDDVPDCGGRTYVITGANSGIGLEATRALTDRGGRVILAVRSTSKGDQARLGLAHPDRAEVRELDLADQSSIGRFVDQLVADGVRVDVLVNNAGIMAVPFGRTVDGFERQIGTNHLGHFALTMRLLPHLAPTGRVVTVSSMAHRMGRFDPTLPMTEAGYDAWGVYGSSKLANLLFAHELATRLAAAGDGRKSVACHPGYAATNLQYVAPAETGSALSMAVMKVGNTLLAQSAAMGACPTVVAAAAPDVDNDDVIGPRGPFQSRGWPTKVAVSAAARDRAAAGALWRRSAELCGVDLRR